RLTLWSAALRSVDETIWPAATAGILGVLLARWGERVLYSTKDCRRSGPHGHLDSELVRAPADRALAGERRQIGSGVKCESHPHRTIGTGRLLPAAQGSRMRHEPASRRRLPHQSPASPHRL